MSQPVAWLALGLLAGCEEQPTSLGNLDSPRFTEVTITDPSTVLYVGGQFSNAPLHLTLIGTVAGIVVAADKAVVDLSKATVDCNGQTGGDPIGVWIQGNRMGVQVVGGGTGTVTNCVIGILIGQLDPNSGDPGGSNNRVKGLTIQQTRGGDGCFYCGYAMAVSNSHDNVVNQNNIFGASVGGIFVHGSDPTASASGGNQISNSKIEGFGDFGIIASSNNNQVRDNLVLGWFFNITVDEDANVISGNQAGYLDGSCGCTAVWVTDGADDNVISDNKELGQSGAFDAVYFRVETNTFRNLIRGNTATTTDGLDALDQSGNCVNNSWTGNTFTSKDPACIQ